MTRPLIFSPPMVRALLDGRKTMTRRIIKPRPFSKDGDFVIIDIASRAEFRRGADGRFYYSFEHPRGGPLTAYVAYCAPGDRIWVKEAWQDYCPALHGAWCGCGSQEMVASTHRPVYRADPVEDHKRSSPDGRKAPPLRWRSPMFMPRWASRLTLIVESVRVERLQKITEADAEREGAEPILVPPDGGSAPHVEGFRELWQSLHGPVSWEANPWVAVIGFRVVRANIDAPSASARITSTE